MWITTILVLLLLFTLAVFFACILLAGCYTYDFKNWFRYKKERKKLEQQMTEMETEDQLLRIQQSTKTSIKWFIPVHDRLRMKYGWYYRWHMNPYANKVHMSFLTMFIVAIFAGGFLGIFGFPHKVHGSNICTSAEDGPWSEIGWEDCNEGKPQLGDSVIINTAVTLDGAVNLGAGNLTINAGKTLNTTTTNYNITANNFTINGTLTANGSTFNVGGAWDHSGGAFSRGTSTIIFTGTTASINTGGSSKQITNLQATVPGQTLTLASRVYANGTFTVGSATDAGNDRVVVTGSQWLDLSTPTNPIVFQGSYQAGASTSGGYNIDNIIIDFISSGLNGGSVIPAGRYGGVKIRGGGSVTFALQGDVTTTTLDLSEVNSSARSILNLDGHDLTCNGSVTVGVSSNATMYSKIVSGTGTVDINGSLTLYDGGGNNEIDLDTSTWYISGGFTNKDTLTPDTSTVVFDGSADQTITTTAETGSNTFYNLTLNNTGTSGSDDLLIAGPLNLDVENLVKITNGDLDPGAFNVTLGGLEFNTAGDGSFTRGAGTVTFDNSGTWTDSRTSKVDLGAITIDGTEARLTLGSSVVATSVTVGADDFLNLGAGGYTLEITGSGTGASIPLSSSSTSFEKGTNSTVKYSGTAATDIAAVQYNNLNVTPSSGSVTYTLTGNLTDTLAMTGGLTIGTNATLDATTSNFNITLGGSWANSNAFTARAGTVTLNGTSEATISGANIFNNLVFDSTAGAKIVKITAGTTQTVGGTLTLSGAASDKRITFQSTTDGEAEGDRYTFAIAGDISDVNYVNVRDFAVTGGTITPVSATCTNNGNNSGWVFNQAPSVPASLTQATSPAGVAIAEAAWTNDNSPNLGFTITDPDDGDKIKYQLQVATDSGFSSLVLDYTHGSTSASGTTFAFTVGSYAGGACSGSCPLSLSDNATGYWWRVRAVDEAGLTSDYSLFGVAGTADIKVDATAPGTTTPSATTPTKDTTPTWNWNAATDGTGSGVASYMVKIGTTSGGADTLPETSAGSNLEYTPLSALSEDSYYLSVKAIDNAGNSGDYTASAELILDLTAPSGNISVSNYTTSTTINISLSNLTDEGGSGINQMQFSNNGTDSWSDWETTGSGKNGWDLTAYGGNGSEGTKTVYVRFNDNAGNVSDPISDTIIYDIIAPSVSPQASAPNGSDNYYITIPTISLSSSDDGSGVNKVYYRWQNTETYTTYTSGNISSPPIQGNNTLYYYAEDNAGNSSIEPLQSSSYLIDTNAPVSLAISIDEGNYTNSADINLTLAASDSISGMNTIELSENGTNWGAPFSYATAKAYSIAGGTGNKTIYARFNDHAGNISESVSDTIIFDSQGPTKPGTPSTTAKTNDTTPNWSWTSSTDSLSGLNSYAVRYGEGSWTNIGDNTSWTSTTLEEGSYSLTVKAIDNATNESDVSDAGTVLIDTTAPTISLFSVNNTEDTITSSTSVTLKMAGLDASAGLSSRGVSNDGLNFSYENCNDTTCIADKAWTLSDGDGTKTVYLKFVDAAGNTSTVSSDTILLDTTGPGAFSLYSPANNYWTNQKSIQLSWEAAADLASGLKSYQLYLDNALLDGNIASSVTTYTLSDLTLGQHTWQIKAIDNQNHETLSEKRTFGIDQSAPTIPTGMSATNLSNKELSLTKVSPVVYEWEAATDQGAGVGSYLVYIGSQPGRSDIVNGEEVATTRYEAKLTTDGYYYFSVKAKGKAGNFSPISSEYKIRFDGTAPSIISKLNVFDISNRIIGVYGAYASWTASADSNGEGMKEYEVYLGNEKLETIAFTVSGKESPRHIVKLNLTPGRHIFKVRGIDLAGNESAFSTEVPVEITAKEANTLTISDIKSTPSKIVDPDSGKTSVLINWKTSSLATSVVDLEGKTYGDENLSKLNTGHAILITDLKASTSYRYKVISRDIYGNTISSESNIFRTNGITKKQSTLEIIIQSLRDVFTIFTKASAAALEKIGVIKPTQITKEGLLAYNVSDPETNSYSAFISLAKAGQVIEKSEDGKNFSTLATPSESYYIDETLAPTKTYYYRTKGNDGVVSIRPDNKDDVAPTIIEPKIIDEATQLSDDKAMIAISWQTDRPSTSQVVYGQGSPSIETTKDDSLNTSHLVILDGLAAGSDYKYKVKSAADNGAESQSGDLAFATPKKADNPSVLEIIVKQFQDIVSKFSSWFRS